MTEPRNDDDLADAPPRLWRPQAVPEAPVMVRFRTVSGELQLSEIEVGADGRPTGVLAVRSVVVDGRTLTQKWVPSRLGADTPAAYDLLDAEVRALSRIAQVYATGHPAQLPVLRGYNVDVDEPFLLVAPYSAPQVSQLLRTIEQPAERNKFVYGLLTSLWLSKTAGVTHRGITLDNLRWDGRTVLLTDFERAQLRSLPGAALDVMAVGTVIRQIHLGVQPAHNFGGDPPHLQQELKGVFDPHWQARPELEELMDRYRVPTPQVNLTEPAAEFVAGKSFFERASTVKRGGPQPPVESRLEVGPTTPTRRDEAGVPAVVTRRPAVGWIAVGVLTVLLVVALFVFVLPAVLGGVT